MKGRRQKTVHAAMLILFLLSALLPGTAGAELFEPDWPGNLPGLWTLTGYEDEEEGTPEVDLAYLTLGENGEMSFRKAGADGQSAYSLEGTWRLDREPDGPDLMTLMFSSYEDPSGGETRESIECVYDVYEEAWVDDSVIYTALIFMETQCSGTSPFYDVSGWNDVAMYRVQEPNMRVVKCKSFVSLRVSPSTSASRLVKVPLGALVTVRTEYGEENGFLWCAYGDEYGFILSEYLRPIE